MNAFKASDERGNHPPPKRRKAVIIGSGFGG
jgi:hypothetical protein